MKNYYEILEVNPNASAEVIEKAYKVLAKKYHPDLQSDVYRRAQAEQRLKELNEAYDVLSDQILKDKYDRELEQEKLEEIRKMYQDRDISAEMGENYTANRFRNNVENTRKTGGRTTGAAGKNRENAKTVSQEERARINSNLGTFAGIVDLVKQLYHDRPKRENLKEMTKKDVFAIVLTIIIVFLIGVLLWFIPFTNGWMREFLFENPLFNWIGGLFS